MCVSALAVVLVVTLSPKSQNEFVIVPVEKSVKETLKGQSPLVGSAEKAAEGGTAAEPVSKLVGLPALPATTARLLNAAAFVGLKLTNTRPVWPEATLKGLPLWIANGGTAVTLPVRTSPPLLITRKLCVLDSPMTNWPKSRLV